MLNFGAGLVLAAHLLVLLAPDLAGAALVHALLNMLLPLLAATFRLRRLRWPLAQASLFSAAFLSATLQAGSALHDRLHAALDGQVVELTGVVASFARSHESSVSFILEDARLVQADTPRLPARIKVSWFMSARVPGPGEQWRLLLRLRMPRGTLNPGGFDQEAWLFRERIGATASVVNSEANARLRFTNTRPVLRLRSRIAAFIDGALAGHPAHGMVAGLAVGLRHRISGPQWQTLADTGTGHLVAISGLHVGLVAGFVYLLTRLAWGWLPPLAVRIAPVDVAWLPALFAAFSYALLAGFAMPTRRALLMLCLWFCARAMRRPTRPAGLLSLTLIGSLAMDGLSVLSPGFWLSFGAVATLILAAPRVTRSGRLRLVPLQGLVFTGLAPVTFAAFGKLPLVSPLANLIMIPLFSFLVIPLVLGCLAIAPVAPGLAGQLLVLPAGLIEGAWPLLEWLADAHRLQWLGPGQSGALLAALLMISLVGLAPRWPGKPALLGSLVVAIMLARPAAPPRGGVEVTVLDVGHGLAVIVRTHHHALLYDAGPGRGKVLLADQVIVPALAMLGVARPDLIILSHDDASHVAGAASLSRRYPGAVVVTGAPRAMARRLERTDLRACEAGRAWDWDGVMFAFLQPGREILWEDNDSSCVLQISVADTRILITGDLTVRGERRLLQRFPGLRADVVIGLNHGSKTASDAGFVAALGATLAIFSTAWVNAWGLPSEKVLGLWQKHGAAALHTGDSGAVQIRAGWQDGGWQVAQLRKSAARPWRAAPLR